MPSTKEEATELEWLRYFYANADFGPADDDVRQIIQGCFEAKTGKSVPASYREEY